MNLKKNVNAGSRFSCWTSSNVTAFQARVLGDSDQIEIGGRLTDNQPGFVKCIVEPPTFLEAVSVEIAAAPAIVEIPTLGLRGMLVVAILLAAAALFALRPRRAV